MKCQILAPGVHGASPRARLHQPQEGWGETGTHLACPGQAGKGAEQPFLDSCPAVGPETLPTHSDAPGHPAQAKGGGVGEPASSSKPQWQPAPESLGRAALTAPMQAFT